MEHSGLHPEFGLFSPTRRLRRELRIAAISLLCGGIAGALCVSGVVALRHSDRIAVESAEGPGAAASQDSELGTAPNTDARAASLESRAGTAAAPRGSPEVPAQRSSETSPPDVAPASAIAPKVRMVRIRKAVDSPPIARIPLGSGEAPAAASLPADSSGSRQTVDTTPAGNDVVAAGSEKAVVGSAAREGVANSSPPKKKQKTVRTASRRNDIDSDSFWHDERQDDWRARAAAVNDGRGAAGRAYAREGSFPARGFWDWSR
jgi:hypothetical protein